MVDRKEIWLMRLLTFGEYKGRSFEWVFFNKPWWIQWVYSQDAKGKWVWHNPQDEVYFNELYRRADNLTGVCPWCKQQPITRMSLVHYHGDGRLGQVAFCCEECQYIGGSPVSYVPASFFVPYKLPRCGQIMIVGAIKHQFIGDGRLTQKKMEVFFQTDHFFPDATPGFFGDE